MTSDPSDATTSPGQDKDHKCLNTLRKASEHSEIYPRDPVKCFHVLESNSDNFCCGDGDCGQHQPHHPGVVAEIPARVQLLWRTSHWPK